MATMCRALWDKAPLWEVVIRVCLSVDAESFAYELTLVSTQHLKASSPQPIHSFPEADCIGVL